MNTMPDGKTPPPLPIAPIRTPYGIALEPAPTSSLSDEVALLASELSRALIEIDVLRRRVTALERRDHG
jgi:hypothetical protein